MRKGWPQKIRGDHLADHLHQARDGKAFIPTLRRPKRNVGRLRGHEVLPGTLKSKSEENHSQAGLRVPIVCTGRGGRKE